MKTKGAWTTACFAVLAMCWLGCVGGKSSSPADVPGTDDPGTDDPGTDDPGTDDPGQLVQHSFTSECGGFRDLRMDDAEGEGEDDYCDAEVLHWAYDAQSATLELTDARILLNCCGDHDVSLAVVDGVHVVTETDAPVGGDGRCDCMCVFDFGLEVEGIQPGVITLRIERHVTDSGGGPEIVWEDDVDLSEGSGAIVVDDTDLGFWCGEE